MKTVSIVINLDTRPANLVEGNMGSGVTSSDLLVETVKNKINFFKGFDIEVIAFIDIHKDICPFDLHGLSQLCDKIVLSKHKSWGVYGAAEATNDYNYLHALSLAKGEYVAHFDMDMAAFTRDKLPIIGMMQALDEGKHDYICYPSEHSPAPCHDDSYDYWWASTRFFLCRREVMNIGYVQQCMESRDFFNQTYPSSKNNYWMEHYLGRIAGKGMVFYPPFDLTNYAIFSFKTYHHGLMKELNEMDYDSVGRYINSCRGIFYPCDLTAIPINKNGNN